MTQPYFSIVIPVYNREAFIKRCIESCLAQTYEDFEIVVVDDASTDNTVKILEQINDVRLRIIKSPINRGVSPSRHACAKNATGKWVIGVDSDCVLFPNSLQKLFEITNTVSDEIIVIRARSILDTGEISPSFVPDQPINYIDRIKWVEKEGGSDALMCSRREIFEKVIYEPDRRTQESLFQLNLAQQGLILYLKDILSKGFTNAPNRVTSQNFKSRVRYFKLGAPDMLWMYEETLRLHGSALKEYGPNQYLDLFRNIALQNFYIGHRWKAVKSMFNYLRKRPFDLTAWIVMVLGIMGPNVILYGNAIRHWLRSKISRRPHR